MKIILAAPLYPPEVGGPSQYAFHLNEEFRKLGHEVSVVRYGGLKKLPTGIRHLAYAFRLLGHVRGADVIIAFDTYSVGLPAACVSKLTRTPLVIRIGGDFLWEQYVERTGDLVPLPAFYATRPKWNLKERVIFRLTRFVLFGAAPVFNSPFLRDIWGSVYRIQRAAVIENAFGPCEGGTPPARKNFLLFARPIALKNAPAFRRAFSKAKERHPDVVLEEGNVPYEPLLERIKSCYAVAVPSVSEVAPNLVLDALRFGKPFILTKYSGYAERFKEYGVIVDPLDEQDMQRGVEELVGSYETLQRNARSFHERHGWEEVAREFLAITGQGAGVLMLGSDRALFDAGSVARMRARTYAEMLRSLVIIIPTLRDARFRETRDGPLTIIPTNSSSKLFFGRDTKKVSRGLGPFGVISAQDPFEYGFIAARIARATGARLYVQVHTDFLAPSFSREYWPLNALRRLIAGFVLRRADRIRVVSARLKREIAYRYKPRAPITVLPICIDLGRFRGVAAPAELVARFSRFETKLLVVSRLEEEKDVALAIEAFAESAPPTSCLIILGEGSQRGKLEKLAAKLEVGERVFFEGKDDPAAYYALCDAVLVTSRYEGYGLVIIEALAAGKPVISTDVGIAREAGATVASRGDFPQALATWFRFGPRQGTLASYPYADFDDYVRRYCGDLAACIAAQKKQ